jgi:hypothetical protein
MRPPWAALASGAVKRRLEEQLVAAGFSTHFAEKRTLWQN